MQQYLDLEHIKKVEEHADETSPNNTCYYLPHHRVLWPDKTATKLKVVFNGSASTTSAAKVALQDVYMNDVVSGAQNLVTARQLQCYLQNTLETCGVKLHKWNSNSKELLNSSTDQEPPFQQMHSTFSINAELAPKTLGYADASESAYGAVVYMHSVKEYGTTLTKLIASKSRIAVIKVISSPRLEILLCLMLGQLVENVASI
ncbi:DUF1758 domain-containing protein [Trichonephila clavata]|uniref:DUF1758 domain-containing protein n=1 Tax=Trichonephila clavata TaxID=2740835 RepID=A0A8X6FHA9_TRICU|nr:DUF1758 domain-containing protein [Trichonephila clavata]